MNIIKIDEVLIKKTSWKYNFYNLVYSTPMLPLSRLVVRWERLVPGMLQDVAVKTRRLAGNRVPVLSLAGGRWQNEPKNLVCARSCYHMAVYLLIPNKIRSVILSFCEVWAAQRLEEGSREFNGNLAGKTNPPWVGMFLRGSCFVERIRCYDKMVRGYTEVDTLAPDPLITA